MEKEEYQEDLKEIADIVESFYTEGDGKMLPKHLLPIAPQLSLIQRIATGKHREQLKRMQEKLERLE